jgi:hypothetical protein
MKIGVSPILPKISNRFPKQVGESQNGVRFGDSNEVRLETRKGGTKEGGKQPLHRILLCGTRSVLRLERAVKRKVGSTLCTESYNAGLGTSDAESELLLGPRVAFFKLIIVRW